MNQQRLISVGMKMGIVTLAWAIQMGNARAVTMAGATWDASVNLDFAAGSTAPTAIGGSVVITTGNGGKFDEGIHLPAGGSDSTRVLQYDGLGNLDKNQGTVTFWYKPGVDYFNFTGGRILTIETAAGGGGRLVDIYAGNPVGGGWDSYMSANGMSSSATTLYDADDWLYFAFVWDAAVGSHRMWVGINSGMATNYAGTAYAPWTPSAGNPDSINIGSFDGTVGSGQFSRGVWDDLFISDQVLFDPNASAIPMPLSSFTVTPEPSIAGLLGIGALVGGWWRRRK